jgi:hypothetical protein
MSLLQNTQKLLKPFREKGMKPGEVLKVLGDGIEREWFYKFYRGAIDDPTVSRIQKLHDTLKKVRLSN